MYPQLEYHPGAYLKKPIKPVVDFLQNKVKEGDLVAFTNEASISQIDFYNKGRSFNARYLFAPQILDTSWKRPLEENNYYISIRKISSLKFKRLWVVCSDWARSGGLDENSSIVKEALDSKFVQIFSREFTGLWIYAYQLKDPAQ